MSGLTSFISNKSFHLENCLSLFLKSFLSVFLSFPKFCWRAAHVPTKRCAKPTGADVSHGERNLCDRERLVAEQPLCQLKSMMHDELFDAIASAVAKPAVDVVASDAALRNDVLRLQAHLEETLPTRAVHRPHVRGPVRVRFGQLVQIRSPFNLNNLGGGGRRANS